MGQGGEIKHRPSCRITARDVDLLAALYQNVVLSFPQIVSKVFPGRAKSTVLNRLAQLESMRLIQRWKVPRLRAGADGKEILVVFQITRRGMKELERRQPTTVRRDTPVGLNGYALHHDVLLVDVMEALREKFPGARVIHGRLIERDPGAGGTEPDSVIEMNDGKERWAVELELTAKSERRYREIVLRYRLDRTFTRVLYVTDGPRVGQKLARVLGEKLGAACPNPSNQKFLGLGLEELFQTAKGGNP